MLTKTGMCPSSGQPRTQDQSRSLPPAVSKMREAARPEHHRLLPFPREDEGGAALDIPGSVRVDRFAHAIAAIGGMLARPEEAPCSVCRRREERLGNDARRQIATKIEDNHDHDGHSQPHNPASAREKSDMAVILGLLAVLMFSPCEGFLPVYLPGVSYGWTGFLLLSGVLAVATLAGMVTFTWLSLAGLERLKLAVLEQYENAVLGGLLVLLGTGLFNALNVVRALRISAGGDIAAVFGSAGQGNYSAANAFLDALAHHRALGIAGVEHQLGRLGRDRDGRDFG